MKKTIIIMLTTALLLPVSFFTGCIWPQVTTDDPPEGAPYKDVAAGYFHSLAIEPDNSLWVWGANDKNQLGDGSDTDRDSPVKIMDDVTAVAAGNHYNLAIQTDGSLWFWGGEHLLPYQISSDAEVVSTGFAHNLVVKTDGSLWAWGSNYHGQLGNGKKAPYDNENDEAEPVKIMDDVQTAAAGGYHSLAVKKDGSLWAWGDNSYGQRGDDLERSYHDTDKPSVPVKIMDDVQTAAAGEFHSMALKTDGSLWTWGDSTYGQLGTGTTAEQSTPVKIMDDVARIFAGRYHNFAIKTDGSLWSWGDNFYGQLGYRSSNNSLNPLNLNLDGVTNVAAGDRHTLVLRGEDLFAWGDNYYGQLEGGVRENGEAPKSRGSQWKWISDNGKRDLAEYEDYELIVFTDHAIEKSGYKDLYGNIIVEPKFDEASPFSHGLALVGKVNKYTYLNKGGKLISDYTWDVAYDFNSFGVAVVGIGEVYIGDLAHFDGRYGLIDRDGKYVRSPEWEGDLLLYENQMSEEGLMPVGIQSEEQSDEIFAGYSDSRGTIVIPPKWRYATEFHNGRALVSNEYLPVYWYFRPAYDDESEAEKQYRYNVIDTTGKVILTITKELLNERKSSFVQISFFGDDYLAAYVYDTRYPFDFERRTVYLDFKGNLVPRNTVLNNITFDWHGICRDNSTEKYGIHSEGRILVNPVFDHLEATYGTSEGVFYAELDDKEGYIYVEAFTE